MPETPKLVYNLLSNVLCSTHLFVGYLSVCLSASRCSQLMEMMHVMPLRRTLAYSPLSKCAGAYGH